MSNKHPRDLSIFWVINAYTKQFHILLIALTILILEIKLLTSFCITLEHSVLLAQILLIRRSITPESKFMKDVIVAQSMKSPTPPELPQIFNNEDTYKQILSSFSKSSQCP